MVSSGDSQNTGEGLGYSDRRGRPGAGGAFGRRKRKSKGVSTREAQRRRHLPQNQIEPIPSEPLASVAASRTRVVRTTANELGKEYGAFFQRATAGAIRKEKALSSFAPKKGEKVSTGKGKRVSLKVVPPVGPPIITSFDHEEDSVEHVPLSRRRPFKLATKAAGIPSSHDESDSSSESSPDKEPVGAGEGAFSRKRKVSDRSADPKDNAAGRGEQVGDNPAEVPGGGAGASPAGGGDAGDGAPEEVDEETQDGFPMDKCTVTDDDMIGFSAKYGLPPHMSFEIPNPTDRMHLPLEGRVAVNVHIFKHFGLRFPLDPRISRILTDMEISLSQLNMNAIAFLVGWVILCAMHDIPCSTQGFNMFFKFIISGTDRMVSVAPRGQLSIFNKLPASHGATRNWRPFFVYLRSSEAGFAWGFPRQWRTKKVTVQFEGRFDYNDGEVEAIEKMTQIYRGARQLNFYDLFCEPILHLARVSSVPPWSSYYKHFEYWIMANQADREYEEMMATKKAFLRGKRKGGSGAPKNVGGDSSVDLTQRVDPSMCDEERSLAACPEIHEGCPPDFNNKGQVECSSEHTPSQAGGPSETIVIEDEGVNLDSFSDGLLVTPSKLIAHQGEGSQAEDMLVSPPQEVVDKGKRSTGADMFQTPPREVVDKGKGPVVDSEIIGLDSSDSPRPVLKKLRTEGPYDAEADIYDRSKDDDHVLRRRLSSPRCKTIETCAKLDQLVIPSAERACFDGMSFEEICDVHEHLLAKTLSISRHRDQLGRMDHALVKVSKSRAAKDNDAVLELRASLAESKDKCVEVERRATADLQAQQVDSEKRIADLQAEADRKVEELVRQLDEERAEGEKLRAQVEADKLAIKGAEDQVLFVEDEAIALSNALLKVAHDVIPLAQAAAIRKCLRGVSHKYHVKACVDIKIEDGFELAVEQIRHLGGFQPGFVPENKLDCSKTGDLSGPLEPSRPSSPTTDPFTPFYDEFEAEVDAIHDGIRSSLSEVEDVQLTFPSEATQRLNNLGWICEVGDGLPRIVRIPATRGDGQVEPAADDFAS